jgi:hypothetical protein
MHRGTVSRIIALLLFAVIASVPASTWAQYIYAVQSDGVLRWREHLGGVDGSASWSAVQQPGSGWQSFKDAFPGGDGVIYAIQTDGTLLWYKHLGYRDGSFTWAGPNIVGNSWQTFKAVFSGGDGIIYAIQNDGVLLWYKHRGHLDGSSAWDGPLAVGVGWQSFLSVFAGEDGAIYGIQPDGTLLWYKHLGRNDGSFNWQGPIAVGAGWNGFQHVFASADGVIYAVTPGGTLLWYKHRGYLDGGNLWDGPAAVDTGWSSLHAFAVAAPLEGYCSPLSAAPGENVSFMVSSPSAYEVTFSRFQRQGDQNAAIPMTAPQAEAAGLQGLPAQAWANGCGWSSSFDLRIPPAWPSGIYAAECTDGRSRTFRIVFIVKPSPQARGDFAVLANTNTWNAYNDWDGRSKYTSPPGQYLSFLRPNPAAAPIDAGGLNHLARAELWVLDWLTSCGYHVDVYTDTDMHRGIPDLSQYKGLILDTHNEYWSLEMLDNLEAYLAGGGSLVYMSGNGIFEKVIFSPDANTLTMFPEGVSLDRSESYFRNLVPPRPERAVLGIAFRYEGYLTFAPFEVLQAGHRFFAGTGVVNGSLVGAAGINGGGASGWEMDTSIAGLAPDGVIVSANGADDRGSPPANIELLARGTNAGGYGADMTYYQTPAGGGVFAAGSISFGGSLVIDPALQRIVRNVLDEYLLHGSSTGVRPGNGTAVQPRTLALQQNFPNPFNPATTLRYVIPAPGQVTLAIYDARGSRVSTLVDAEQEAGEHGAKWLGLDARGAAVSSGVYYARLVTPYGQRSLRVTLAR